MTANDFTFLENLSREDREGFLDRMGAVFEAKHKAEKEETANASKALGEQAKLHQASATKHAKYYDDQMALIMRVYAASTKKNSSTRTDEGEQRHLDGPGGIKKRGA